ncbi:hypothetical protein HDU76_008645, partial [Blyttiomyces sp. JEL0837]
MKKKSTKTPADSGEGNGSSVDGTEAGGEDMENSDNGSRIDYGLAAEDNDGNASFEIADLNVLEAWLCDWKI